MLGGTGLPGGRRVLAFEQQKGDPNGSRVIPRLATPFGAALLVLGFLASWVEPGGHLLPLAIPVILIARLSLGDVALFTGALALFGLIAHGRDSIPFVLAVLLTYPLWGLLRQTRLAADLRLLLATGLLAVLAMWPFSNPTIVVSGVLAAIGLAGTLRLALAFVRSDRPELEDASLAILLLLVTAALSRVSVCAVALGLPGAAFAVLVATMRRVEGILIAPLAGIVLYLMGAGPASAIGGLALGAAFAAGLRPLGAVPMAGGFLVGMAGLEALVAWPVALSTLWPVGIAAALFAVLPRTFWRRRRPFVVLHDVSGPRDRLSQVSLALREMASALLEPDERGGPDLTLLIRSSIADKVCAGCPQYGICWQEREAYTQLGFRQALVDKAPGAPFVTADIPEEVRLRCPRQEEVALAATFIVETRSREEAWRERLSAVSQLLGTEIRQAAGLIDLALRQKPDPPREVPSLTFTLGLARVAKGGAVLSGDAATFREMPGARLLMALSDGMGVGSRAYREASIALDLVERLLALEVPTPELLDMVNAYLMLRSPRGSFATLDFAVLDLGAGEAEVFKVGGAPSFLVSASGVERLVARSAPAGILWDARPHIFSRPLRPGDALVFVSDGILASGEPWLEKILADSADVAPQALAEGIISAAIDVAGGKASDDLTALLCRIGPPAMQDTGQVRALLRRSLGRSRIGAVPAGKAGS